MNRRARIIISIPLNATWNYVDMVLPLKRNLKELRVRHLTISNAENVKEKSFCFIWLAYSGTSLKRRSSKAETSLRRTKIFFPQSWTKGWRQIDEIKQNRIFYGMFYSWFFAIFYQKMWQFGFRSDGWVLVIKSKHFRDFLEIS